MSDSTTKAKKMDGPVVKWTVGDIFRSHPKLFMTYHVVDAGYDLLTPLGVAVGGLAYAAGYRPLPNLPQILGTAGLIGGSTGVMLGCARITKVALQGEKASPPWNKEGIQVRVDGLSHNFNVRVLDKSVWLGAAAAAAAVAYVGGPQKVGLSPGPLGYAQAISLGSAAGSVSGMTCIAVTRGK